METVKIKEPEIEKVSSYLSFYLGDEQFAILVSKVIEIMEVPRITKVPKTSDYMVGVINLRGSVLPIVDINLKFGLKPKERTPETCIIVMKININEEVVSVGILADAVDEVLNISENQISEPPSMGGGFNKEFLTGMAKVEERFLMLLDIDGIMNKNETELLKNVGSITEKKQDEDTNTN